MPAFELQQVCEWPNFLSSWVPGDTLQKVTSPCGSTWPLSQGHHKKQIGISLGSTQISLNSLALVEALTEPRVKPLGVLKEGFDCSSVLKGNRAGIRHSQDIYLPQLNTNYCYLRWKIIRFLWIQQNTSGMLSQMMEVTVDTSSMGYKMCVVTKKGSFSSRLPRLTPFYLLFIQPAQELLVFMSRPAHLLFSVIPQS